MPRISRLKAFASVFALLPVLGFALPASHAATSPVKGSGDAASCRALAGRTIAPGMRVLTAEYDADGTIVEKTHISQPLCRVTGVANPTADSRIGYEVWMPPASAWNGKFQAVGSGASAARFRPARC